MTVFNLNEKLGLLMIFIFAFSVKGQNLSSILSQIPKAARVLVSATLYDFSTFNNSQNIIILDQSLNSLPYIGDKLIMGLYLKYSSLLNDYRFDPPDFQQNNVSLFVNPCTSLSFLDKCKVEVASGPLNNIRVPALQDILIMIRYQNFLFDCNNNYVTINQCGTFLEIHRPFDETIIIDKRVDQVLASPVYEYMTTKDLCAGKYEVRFD